MEYATVLTIAGSDPSGGAGVQADIKTISALGCYAASAITALTIQNTMGVSDVFAIPTDVIRAQIEAVLSDVGAKAVKTGMLHNAEVVRMVATSLRHYNINNVVVDPVMVSTSGHRLIEETAIEALSSELLPCARIVTPNIPEAEILLGQPIRGQADLYEAARLLSDRLGTSVLLKAGHLVGDQLIDICYDRECRVLLELPTHRVDTPNTHGTGCTLSSALASYLAKGYTVGDAARAAKRYIDTAIQVGARYTIGHGHGPVCHFFSTLD